MVSPEFYDRSQEFVGSTGLILFGEDLVYSYVRDGNTTSCPHEVDLAGGGRDPGESPFETFQRETYEEAGLRVASADIVYARKNPVFIRPVWIGWFAVAQLETSAVEEIVFGSEGERYQVTSMDELLEHPRLIPFRLVQIHRYLMAVRAEHLSREAALLPYARAA